MGMINADETNTFTVGHNYMSSWTKAEYKKMLGYTGPKSVDTNATLFKGVPTTEGKDWRTEGAVNAPKNQGYQGGVINSDACGRSLDHAITAIGWGSDDKQDYYIVRNSWGAEWGDAGYLKIAAGGDYCGIENISVF